MAISPWLIHSSNDFAIISAPARTETGSTRSVSYSERNGELANIKAMAAAITSNNPPSAFS